MDSNRDEEEEFYELGCVEHLVLTWRAHFAYTSKEMKPGSQLDRIGTQNESTPLHVNNLGITYLP